MIYYYNDSLINLIYILNNYRNNEKKWPFCLNILSQNNWAKMEWYYYYYVLYIYMFKKIFLSINIILINFKLKWDKNIYDVNKYILILYNLYWYFMYFSIIIKLL